MKIALVLGTRPEIIKMASLIRACQEKGIDFFTIHSNQHYSKEMDALIFKDLNLPTPEYNLEVGSGIHGQQTGKILERIEQVYIKEKPTHVLVQGDTNTTLAGALAAKKLHIPVGHIEAGLRSFDSRMPEETNRTLVDHMSDFCFCPTEQAKQYLLQEGIAPSKIHIVGNTVSDAVIQHLDIAKEKSTILKDLKITSDNYFLATAHRAENIDDPQKLQNFINTFETLSQNHNLPVIFPVHPRTDKNIKEHKIQIPNSITTTPPLGYLDMLELINHAKLVITDSGGLQEESCILKTKCITIRENTERPETVKVGGNIIAGVNPENIITATEEMLNKPVQWSNPFGNGTTAKQCIEILITTQNTLQHSSQNTDSQNKTKAPQSKNKTVCVVGLGYMGLPTASLLATNGYQVIGVDINQTKIDEVNNGRCPFDEPGLPELVKKAHQSKNLHAQKEMPTADIYVIAVPTPVANRKINLEYVKAAAENIAPALKENSLVIIESTVAPNTCKNHIKPILDKSNKNYFLSHCPERAIPGNTLYELVHNDRIIGGLTEQAAEITKELYKDFIKGKIYTTDITTAETCKLLENTFRDSNIALANEFAKIAEDLEIDIWETIELANKHPRVNILSPGPGVGGHCLAVDPWFLTEATSHAKIIPAAREVNDSMPEVVANLASKHHLTITSSSHKNLHTKKQDSNTLTKANNTAPTTKHHLATISNITNTTTDIPKSQTSKTPATKIGILGVAYKKNVDDARETPATKIIELLKEKNHDLLITDPFVKNYPHQITSLEETLKNSTTLILITDHDIYSQIDFTNHPNIKTIIDTRNALKGKSYKNIQILTLGNYKATTKNSPKNSITQSLPPSLRNHKNLNQTTETVDKSTKTTTTQNFN